MAKVLCPCCNKNVTSKTRKRHLDGGGATYIRTNAARKAINFTRMRESSEKEGEPPQKSARLEPDSMDDDSMDGAGCGMDVDNGGPLNDHEAGSAGPRATPELGFNLSNDEGRPEDDSGEPELAVIDAAGDQDLDPELDEALLKWSSSYSSTWELLPSLLMALGSFLPPLTPPGISETSSNALGKAHSAHVMQPGAVPACARAGGGSPAGAGVRYQRVRLWHSGKRQARGRRMARAPVHGELRSCTAGHAVPACACTCARRGLADRGWGRRAAPACTCAYAQRGRRLHARALVHGGAWQIGGGAGRSTCMHVRLCTAGHGRLGAGQARGTCVRVHLCTAGQWHMRAPPCVSLGVCTQAQARVRYTRARARHVPGRGRVRRDAYAHADVGGVGAGAERAGAADAAHVVQLQGVPHFCVLVGGRQKCVEREFHVRFCISGGALWVTWSTYAGAGAGACARVRAPLQLTPETSGACMRPSPNASGGRGACVWHHGQDRGRVGASMACNDIHAAPPVPETSRSCAGGWRARACTPLTSVGVRPRCSGTGAGARHRREVDVAWTGALWAQRG
ncbi:hypothetical protein GGX14DRAFT_404000 [Mycena pura]|uniref:Uncharacterized protein n=1 Tax=Mycena pura TaxID=153505 RepID=A0AAD6UV66_9AGAR|nr:hypothetical protein GGX14DRAFT_404000 [Mycena pura]